MMTEPLTQLRGIVQTLQQHDNQQLPFDDAERLKSSLNELTNKILWGVGEQFALGSHPALITEVQLKLTFYADALNGFSHKENQASMAGNLSVSILEHIFSLLDHLKDYYPQHFNLDARLPDHYCAFKSLGNQAQIQDLIVLMKRQRVDPDFIELLESFLSAGSGFDSFQIKTWRQLVLQQQLMERLTVLLKSIPENPALEIFQVLISLEINSIQVYSYFVKYQERLVLEDNPPFETHKQLNHLIKIFKQVVTPTDGYYDPHAPSLKSSILESLSAEIAFLEKNEQIGAQGLQPLLPAAVSKFYFKVAITLAELMFFFRVALEVKVITTKFNTYLYQFVSNHIQTQRAENFSMQSMRNLYNNKPFPDKVVRVVRSWLVKMIDHIDFYYR